MKKETLLILTYVLVVVALIGAVKVARIYSSFLVADHKALIADCNDGPITTSAGE